MRFLTYSAIALLPTITIAKSSDSDKSDWQPCTAESSTSGNFFDINPLHVAKPDSDSKSSKKDKDKTPTSWHARGYDYGANFTINFCGSVIEDVDRFEDLDKKMWKNVSAFYYRDHEYYSIGSESHEPVVRGRKLVLNYTHGSSCPSTSDDDRRKSKRAQLPTAADPSDEEVSAMGNLDDDYDDNDDEDDDREKGRKHKSSSKGAERRKTSIISLLCERTPKDNDPPVTVSYVGTTDECTYFFEARSKFACPTVKSDSQPLGPSSIFGIIALITGLVYLIGGIMYQRIVQHQRGWRQLPNYSLWSSIFSFVSDMTVIAFSSLGRCIPGVSRLFEGRKGGYNRVGTLEENGFANGNGNARGRTSGNEDENRLIDQLDEQWED